MTCDTPCPLTTIKPTPLIQSETRLDKYLLRWFLEGHVYAFGRLGGVPAEKIRYDNLTSAVKRVVFGRARVENQRWVAFRSHYKSVPASSRECLVSGLLLAAS